MKETYTIPIWEKENVDKAIARFQKKASAYGTMLHVESGEPYAKERAIYEPDEITNTVRQIGTQLVEVYDLTVESDVIRKDGYAIVAKIEHLENGNFVYSFSDQSKPEWTKIESRCEHCNTKHFRRNTFIVRHEDGSEKQVGSTCLKDYCGIDPQHFAALKQLRDLFIEDDFASYDFDHAPKATTVYPIIETIALAYRIVKAQGYRKADEVGSNKSVLIRMLNEREQPTDEELDEARRMKEAVMLMERDDSWSRLNDKRIWFDNSIKSLLLAGYCKDTHLGYIAYAPVAFAQYDLLLEEEEKRRQQHSEQAAVSDFIGEVGQKIDVDVAEMNLLTSWESDWGWTYLYKIIDTAGNVIVWYASHAVEVFKKFRATVKAHNERDGIKQTVVTRCRAI